MTGSRCWRCVMGSELKPCPFCGGAPCAEREPYMGASVSRLFYVTCPRGRCRAYGPGRKTERGAIAAWNRRAKEGSNEQ